ncbi:uncharacterized protein LOC113466550 [Diaphorina citri]|uniref:Uncharacterized protein LOC113466550 n=1 Tax=Diaphorina citri TaxID=121845 RepID=A0A3Q0ITA4_DIACI|nr:uncharacterized protein LOC113466550 [Diaphorina citri]KAI5739792.1 hypothetical protein M8J77_023544 [Diaphorina citri]
MAPNVPNQFGLTYQFLASTNIAPAFHLLTQQSNIPYPRSQVFTNHLPLNNSTTGTLVGHIYVRVKLKAYDRCIVSALQQFTAHAQNGEALGSLKTTCSTVKMFAQRFLRALKYFLREQKEELRYVGEK